MASLSLRIKYHPTITLKPHHNLAFSHLYSSASSNNDNDGNSPSKPSEFSVLFSDIKSKLQQNPQSSSPSFRPPGLTPQSPSSNDGGVDAIRRNLSEFRRRSSEFTPPPPAGGGGGEMGKNAQNPVSFQGLYNKNKSVNPNPNSNSATVGGNMNISFDMIRASLAKMKLNQGGPGGGGSMSLNANRDTVSRKVPVLGNVVGDGVGVGKSRMIGGSMESLPGSVFGKEMKDKEGGGRERDKFELFRPYTHEELGKHLRELRSDVSKSSKEKKGEKKEKEVEENKGEDEGVCFPLLSELQQRLGKLREIEEKKTVGPFSQLRAGLKDLQVTGSTKKPPIQRINILTQPSFMAVPPKEHLVDKYFHPDNMSAAEKLKLELKRVRDEFKMSESDCGSTRVQITQLTTEISHLSSVLQKKDKHSRRGLQAKVQQRKKLLKYLRRTDWDSYCFVLDKFGLRDNPDYKN